MGTTITTLPSSDLKNCNLTYNIIVYYSIEP